MRFRDGGVYWGAVMAKLVKYGVTVSIILTLLIAYFLAQRIARPILEAVGLAEAISKGDLSRGLQVRSKDEVGRLGSALNTMVANLKSQTEELLDAVNALATNSAEISTTVSQLAQSTSKTSAAVTETSSTVEQVKQAAFIASDKAKNVAEASASAVRTSLDGKTATEETIKRMILIEQQMDSVGQTVVRLSDQSKAIEDIIATVQDLADQSNLLAVNASIEAARAGDQGKGFAVVAQEIKTLADQSREATDQIRSILEDTRKWVGAVVMATEQGTKAVQSGAEQSRLAGTAIASLSESVEASAQAASVISATSEQQTTGVDQVATAMTSIDQAMQQNAMGTAQIEEAASKLEGIGNRLKELAAHYKL